MSDLRSEVLFIDYKGEQSLAVDSNWNILVDGEATRLDGLLHVEELAVVLYGLMGAVNTVDNTGLLTKRITSVGDLPSSFARIDPYSLKTKVIPRAQREFVEATNLPVIGRHLHTIGSGVTSVHMLISDETEETNRVSVFEEYVKKNPTPKNLEILEELRHLPLGEVMSRSRRGVIPVLGSEPNQQKIIKPVEKIAPPRVALMLNHKEQIAYDQALRRCSHLQTASSDPYKLLITDIIVHAQRHVSDKDLLYELKLRLGPGFTEGLAERAINSMAHSPIVGNRNKVMVLSRIINGEQITYFSWVRKDSKF